MTRPKALKVPDRIDCDEGGIDDLCITVGRVLIRLERMNDGYYWMRVGDHAFNFHTKRGAHIRASYRNEKTGHEEGFEELHPRKKARRG